MVCDMARGWDKRGEVELRMLCVNRKVDESGTDSSLDFQREFEKDEGIRIRFLHRNCSFRCLLTKKIDLSQFGVIEF
jgi:hypothetical protein